MAFKCEACEQTQDAKARPVLVVTRVQESRFNTGYNTVEELKTCMPCAQQLTEVAPEVLKERSSTQSKLVRDALASLGYRIQQFDAAGKPLPMASKLDNFNKPRVKEEKLHGRQRH